MTEHEQREACRMMFNSLSRWQEEAERRMEERDAKMQNQEISITKLISKMETLTTSIQQLSKALWGAAGFLMITGIGFILWYIQKL